ncbi:MAG: hypothetical protein ACK5LJ_01425 [Paracoccus sp. (in: a-proteobacteria)]
MVGFLRRLLGAHPHESAAFPEGERLTLADLDSSEPPIQKILSHAHALDHVQQLGFAQADGAFRMLFASGSQDVVFLDQLMESLRSAGSDDDLDERIGRAFRDPGQRGEGYLVPVLRSRTFIMNARNRLRPESEGMPYDFWSEEIAPGLSMLLERVKNAGSEVLTRADLDGLGLDGRKARFLAPEELSRFINDRHMLRLSGRPHSRLDAIRLDGCYESSLFFLNSLWASMAAGDWARPFAGPPAAIFAARGSLIFCDSGDGEAMAELRQLARKSCPRSLDAIAPHSIWLWYEQGWQLFDETSPLPGVAL